MDDLHYCHQAQSDRHTQATRQTAGNILAVSQSLLATFLVQLYIDLLNNTYYLNIYHTHTHACNYGYYRTLHYTLYCPIDLYGNAVRPLRQAILDELVDSSLLSWLTCFTCWFQVFQSCSHSKLEFSQRPNNCHISGTGRTIDRLTSSPMNCR